VPSMASCASRLIPNNPPWPRGPRAYGTA
jgi:hypothetical protein